jgi:asparagine N-glycosylation enzyme membrane subunit Stt3
VDVEGVIVKLIGFSLLFLHIFQLFTLGLTFLIVRKVEDRSSGWYTFLDVVIIFALICGLLCFALAMSPMMFRKGGPFIDEYLVYFSASAVLLLLMQSRMFWKMIKGRAGT